LPPILIGNIQLQQISFIGLSIFPWQVNLFGIGAVGTASASRDIENNGSSNNGIRNFSGVTNIFTVS
ncbi:hypothetical protein, partial [Escherichia coli]|uniref:hypothetical protein n=1 Tax=Escherichia coli TaxID=562 RepID=UPI001F4B8A90